MVDEITLTLPRERDFHRVAHLVLGGLAVRLDLTIENLEDLQLALDAILDHTDPARGDITVRMRLSDGELGIRRVLDSTVEDVHVDGEWVRLTKKVATRG